MFKLLAALLVASLATATPIERSPTMPFSPSDVTVHPGDKRRCLRATGTNSGSLVDIAPCDGSAGQMWTVAPGETWIKLKGTNMCVTAGINPLRGWFPNDGVLTVLRPCPGGLPNPADAGSGETWIYDRARRFTYKGSAAHIGVDLCLDNKDGANTGTQTWECFCGNPNQVWTTSPQLEWP